MIRIRFDVIYADPPWQYKAYSTKGKVAENHYRTMNIDDIANLDVKSIASDDSILFLWITFPCLIEGLRVMKDWGFTYKTLGFLWAKRNKVQRDTWFWGLGFWTRSNPELCLIGTKGKPQRMSKAVHSVVEAPIGKHSQKPDEVRSRIEKLMGENVSKLELFARERADGWTCLGNEIDGMDIRDAIEKVKNMEGNL